MWLPGNTLGFQGEMSLGRSLNPEKWLKLPNGPVWGDVSGKQAFGTPQITCPGESHKSQSNLILSECSVKEGEPGSFEWMSSAWHRERDRYAAVPGAGGLCRGQSIQGTILII